MKVAFATQDGIHINAHFGSAKQVALYEVTVDGYEYLETVEFTGNLNEDGNEDKLVPKVKALASCTIVYVSAIGGSAAARLIRHRITPIKVQSEEEKIADLLVQLVQMLQGNPPPWLRKVLQQQSRQFDEELDEFEEEIAV